MNSTIEGDKGRQGDFENRIYAEGSFGKQREKYRWPMKRHRGRQNSQWGRGITNRNSRWILATVQACRKIRNVMSSLSSLPLFLPLFCLLRVPLCGEIQSFFAPLLLSGWMLLTLQTCQSFISRGGGLFASVGGKWLSRRVDWQNGEGEETVGEKA